VCWNCGTSLAGIEPNNKTNDTTTPNRRTGYNNNFGESDLYESILYKTGQRYLYGCFGILIIMMMIGLGLLIMPPLINAVINSNDDLEVLPSPTIPIRNFLPTVTQGPPTLTPTITVIPSETPVPTNTPAPCMQTVRAGDSMGGIVARCGHYDTAIYDLVVEINRLPNAGMIIEGQVLEIPWPTVLAPDPTAIPADAETSSETSAEISVASASTAPAATNATSERSILDLDEEELAQILIIPTATLPPGVQFYTISENDNMYSIIIQHNTSIEAIRNLNPEMTFTQCNMGETFGGERCSVIISPGQQIRVPAPSPMPTLSPTPSGNETATPTPTATFNAPLLQSPSDRATFRNNQLITLRWLPTGTLNNQEVYRVTVEDRTAQILYTAETFETFLIIPSEWQAINEETLDRHQYAWYVDIINRDSGNSVFRTDTWLFTWETRSGN
jgi:hypothetical protein